MSRKKGDDALRQVVGLEDVVDRHLLQSRTRAPVAADHPPHAALVPEMVETLRVAVALPRRIDEGEAERGAVSDKALLERKRNPLGEADADEPAGRQRVAIADELHRLGGGDNLALFVAPVSLRPRNGETGCVVIVSPGAVLPAGVGAASLCLAVHSNQARYAPPRRCKSSRCGALARLQH